MKQQMLITILSLSFLALTGCGVEQVDEGFRGIETRFGKVQGEALTPGLYFYNPISTNIFEMEVREQKWQYETQCFTKDTQTVTVQYAITYYPDPAKMNAIYSQFGKEWDQKIVAPAVLGSLKDAIGKYIADDLVNQREAVKQAAQKEVIDALKARDITVTRLDITNLDFDDGYEKAVEAKVIAIQRAAEEKNKTVQIEEQAKQTVRTAEAQATAMRIQSAALANNPGLTQYEIAKKWNGVLPTMMMGASTPLIDLRSTKQ